MEVPFRRTARGVAVEVRVQPRSSRLAMEVLDGGVLKVRLTAPPAEGEANAQLVEFLAREFGVPKSSVRITRGASSRNKSVEIEGVESLSPRGR